MPLSRFGTRSTPVYQGDIVRIVETLEAEGRTFYVTESTSDGHTAILSEDQIRVLPLNFVPAQRKRVS
jgi:hypothetical protein